MEPHQLLAAQEALLSVIMRSAAKIEETPANRWTLGIVESRLNLLQGYWDTFCGYHLQLLAAGDVAADYLRSDSYSSAEDSFALAQGILLDQQNRLVCGTAGSSTSGSTTSEDTTGTNAPLAQLPRVTIPRFSGKPEEWESFLDLFVDLIHNNTALGDATKALFLLTNVDGSAKEALHSFRATANDYAPAWEALNSRFNQAKLQVQDHLEALLTLQPLEKESANNLQTLLDTLRRHRTMLEALKRPVNNWDDWFVHLASKAMDKTTRRVWKEELEEEERLKDNKDISFDRSAEFLQRRCRTLRSIDSSQPAKSTPSTEASKKRVSESRTVRTHATRTQTGRGCPACKEAHYIGHCLTFKGLEPKERRRLVAERGLCWNCLSGNHAVKDCPSTSTCRNCSGVHHTLIHEGAGKRPSNGANQEEENQDPKRAHIQTAVTRTSPVSQPGFIEVSILPTAIVTIVNRGMIKEGIRALLDPCSEATLVTLSLARALGCRLRRSDVGIVGVSGSTMDTASYQTSLHLLHPETRQLRAVTAFVLRSISIVTPSSPPSTSFADIRGQIQLADSDFDKVRRIDLVLGADVYSHIILPGLQQRGPLLAQRTIFGWTLTGRIRAGPACPRPLHACVTSPRMGHNLSHEQLLGLVQRFWALEEIPQSKRVSPADRDCERIFAERHSRNPDGRYVVPLPLQIEKLCLLGDGLSQAHAALSSTHRRMERDPELGESYRQFMMDYERLGHMRRLTAAELKDPQGPINYIPHHGIWQRNDRGKKLRVAFNASRPTDSGYSLNGALYSGPKLQTHISTVITRWRHHRFVFCADVRMMFRQIQIDPCDIHLQRILWSPSRLEAIVHFVLLTVTYGEASAPYLALRTLKQLCIDEGQNFPLAAKIIEQDLYVDDFLSGSHDLESARHLRDQLIGLLKAGGLDLHKWVANNPNLLDGIPDDRRLRPDWVSFSSEGPVSELGVAWDPVQDCFIVRSPPSNNDVELTKRKTLSELAQTFDPAGWLAPIVITAKLIIQDLWRAKLGWDESLPKPWSAKWLAFRRGLEGAATIAVPRWLGTHPHSSTQLHAFADASRRAIAGVLYARISADESITSTLVCAKTKLTSIKSLSSSAKSLNRMTIPRLELRAALIAAQLIKEAAETLDVPADSCHLWSDSQVVLHWLKSDGPVGNDLVDNYIVHIQELTSGATWHHVPTNENPADVASRGASGETLAAHTLWWNGPPWLTSSENDWPTPPDHAERIDESGTPSTCCLTTLLKGPQSAGSHVERFSTLESLLRATVRSHRLIRRGRKNTPASERSPMDPVTPDDFRWAFLSCVRLTQEVELVDELQQLRRCGNLSGQSPLKSLQPFIDDEGIIRVGGRLSLSALPYDERHPVLLPGHSHLALLVIRWAHSRSLHGGFRATYARVLQRAWITGGKARVKRFLHHCLVCARITARPLQQGMAPLPPARVTPSRPFHKCGVDYAGPFPICRASGRGLSTFKGYVALFVCLSTKAIHLELAGDLTTASFLGALTRFVGRRGKPQEIWSDNWTNFRGADLELRKQLREAEIDWGKVEGEFATEGIHWKFIPPSSPHFGGLWEAGVKSMKAHLRRVIGSRRLTFEEFSTLLVTIESTLNSRPLVPLFGSLEDVEALTPSHFLIGSSSTSLPRPIMPENALSHATHWELVKAMRDSFWERWSKEYLNTLIQRPKWQRPRPNL